MDKKTKKELKKAVKRSRKRLQQIDDPTAWIALYQDGKSETFRKGEFERLRAANTLLKAKLEELKEVTKLRKRLSKEEISLARNFLLPSLNHVHKVAAHLKEENTLLKAKLKDEANA